MKHEDYLGKWEELSPIQVSMVEQSGNCCHGLGDTFLYKTPYEKPAGLCNALMHVLDLYTWRVTLGFPSWEEDDECVFRIHCPSKTGTVWEMRTVGSGESSGES